MIFCFSVVLSSIILTWRPFATLLPPSLLFTSTCRNQALSKAVQLRGGVSAELASKISLGSIAIYAAEMWFTEYANKKYSADKSTPDANLTWWMRWFQLSLVQQASIMGWALSSGGDLTALCKANACNFGLAGARMLSTMANMDSMQVKLNAVVMLIMIAVNLSGAGVI